MEDTARVARKRNRRALNCLECRRRKVRCDRTQPCSQCTSQGVKCDYREYRPTSNNGEERSPGLPSESRPSRAREDLVFTGNLKQPEICMSKTRIFGPSHWMRQAADPGSLGPAGEHLGTLLRHLRSPNDPTVDASMSRCKDLAREIKKSRPSRRWVPTKLDHSLPPTSVMTELLNLYFATFESCYRILYRPSFETEYTKYCQKPTETKSAFSLILSLVAAIAGALHPDQSVRDDMAAKMENYVWVAQTWLSAPLEKDRLTIHGIQISCLLVLARQVCQIGADLIWISLGSTTRMAMQMGFHVDPDFLGEMTLKHKEIRRRLWYTIVEMNVQAALDAGMTPAITPEDYNTRIPVGVDDRDLEDLQTHSSTFGEPNTALFQSTMAQSLALRLSIVRSMNNLHGVLPYEQVLSLSSKLNDAIRAATSTLAQHPRPKSSSNFSACFCSHLLSRLLMCLHFGYVTEALGNPLYAHSTQMCGEIFMDLMLFLEDPLYGSLLLRGGGLFRDILTHGSFMIWIQLINTCLGTDMTPFAQQRRIQQQNELLTVADRITEYTKERMRCGDTSVKAYIFVAITTAQIRALRDGKPVDDAISQAVRDSLAGSEDILRHLLSQQPGIKNDSTAPGWNTDAQPASDFGLFNNDPYNLDLMDDFFQDWQHQGWA